MHLSLEPVVGPDGETWQVSLDGSVATDKKTIAIRADLQPNTSRHSAVSLGKFDDGNVEVGIKLHRNSEWVGPPEEVTCLTAIGDLPPDLDYVWPACSQLSIPGLSGKIDEPEVGHKLL